jgi:hypothetical protein
MSWGPGSVQEVWRARQLGSGPVQSIVSVDLGLLFATPFDAVAGSYPMLRGLRLSKVAGS